MFIRIRLAIGATLFVAAILIPVTAATPSTAPTKLAPPFTSSDFSSYVTGKSTGCSNSSFPVLPYFHSATGKGHFEINASSPACANRAGSLPASNANEQETYFVGLNITGLSGFHTFTMNLSISWKLSYNITIPTCTDLFTSYYFNCQTSASVALSGTPFLAHTKGGASVGKPYTTGSLSDSIGTSWYRHCGTSTCRNITSTKPNSLIVNGTGNVVWSVGSFLNSTKVYYAGFEFKVTVESENDHTNGGSMVGGAARSWASVAETLTSMTVT